MSTGDLGSPALAALLLAACFALAAAVPPAGAAAGVDEDWPCVQRKVPELSAGMMWAGPEVNESDRSWEQDAAVRALVGRLASRRLSPDEAGEAIETFATGLASDKDGRLTALFTGLLQTINTERATIMAGIERYGRRQKELAEKIAALSHELGLLRQSKGLSAAQQARLAELEETLVWDTRVFDERQESLSYVCEVPVLLEQRLFALARKIMEHLD